MGFRRTCCGLLFWLKATFAFLVSVGIYGLFVYKVILLQKSGGAYNAKVVIDGNDPNCQAARRSSARLEFPDNGKIMYGFSIRWQNGYQPQDFAAKLGKSPPILQVFYNISNSFIQLDPTQAEPFRRWDMNQNALDASKTNSIMEVTLEPVVPMDQVPDSLLQDFANWCKRLNENFGVPILLRYGHEMNGPWTVYGIHPVQYVASFRKMATIMRQTTNMTAMLWSPNVGIFYPFSSGPDDRTKVPTAATDPANFAALDTDNNGVFGAGDDPYLPYYPGDEYVDWVGLSLYHYPNPEDANTLPAAGEAANYLTGTNFGFGAQEATLKNFYNRFAVEKDKPMIFSESGAPFIPASPPGPGELAIKRAWWTQLLSSNFRQQFPRLKMILNFEDAKDDGKGSFRNWAIFDNPDIYNQLKADLPQYLDGLMWGTDFYTRCDGSIGFK